MRVCIFVGNNCTVDSRIFRQAGTFARAGHDVRIVAVRTRNVPETERRDGYEIHRVPMTMTWSEGYPRIARVFAPRRERAQAEGSGPPPMRTPTLAHTDAPTASAPRTAKLGLGGWLRWVRTGEEPAPRAWSSPSSTLSQRLRFALLMPTRVTRLTIRRSRAVVRGKTRNQARELRLRFLAPTRYRQIERRMAAAGISFRADLYWANDAQMLRPAAAAARVTGASVVYDAHEVIWDAPSVPWFRARALGLVERTHVRRMNRVYTVCDPIADLMASRYRIPRPTVLLNCPRLDETRDAPHHDDSPLNRFRRPGERLVLFHGRLSPFRGLEQLIDAMSLLPDEYRLVFLGHGPFRETLEALARKAALTDRISFHDSVPADELIAWAVGADVGTIPYQRVGRNHEFSTPNKLFEYMHLGVPVVVNDLPEIRKIVNEVGFGVVTDCSDPAAIAKGIQEVVSDRERYDEMRTRARAAATRYSWERGEPLILEALGVREDR